MQSILFLVCGLPGSSKSTVAYHLARAALNGMRFDVYSADDYFTDENGVYHFDPSKLTEAHAACQKNADLGLAENCNVAVANTFTQFWEIAPYLDIAKRHNARIVIVDCFDGGMTDSELAAKNVHGVPESAIHAMRNRWEFNKHSGDPRPPWLRK